MTWDVCGGDPASVWCDRQSARARWCAADAGRGLAGLRAASPPPGGCDGQHRVPGRLLGPGRQDSRPSPTLRMAALPPIPRASGGRGGSVVTSGHTQGLAYEAPDPALPSGARWPLAPSSLSAHHPHRWPFQTPRKQWSPLPCASRFQWGADTGAPTTSARVAGPGRAAAGDGAAVLTPPGLLQSRPDGSAPTRGPRKGQ